MDASSERDVRKLVRFFENLGASSPDTKKPVSFSSESSDGKGYTVAADGSDSFLMAGGTAYCGQLGIHKELEKAISEKLRERAQSIDEPTVGHPSFGIYDYGELGKSIFEKLIERGQSIDKPTVGRPSFGTKIIYDYGEERQISENLREGEQSIDKPTVGHPSFGIYDYGDDSQLNSEVVYTPVGYSFMSGEQLVAPANIREEIPISVPCHECSKDHPRYSDCPYEPCTVCYQLDHPSVFCPYFRDIPQSAAFDHLRYELFCSCGNLFNEDKWVCTVCCGSMPVLKSKQCFICDSSLDHSSWECPKDEDLAAEYRETRERMLSGAYSCVPIPPRGCGQMKDGNLIGSTNQASRQDLVACNLLMLN